MPTDLDALLDGFEAAWSARDPAAFTPWVAADLHYEDPLTPDPLEGPEALGRHAQRLWAGFPDARVQRTGGRLVDDEGRWAAAPAKLLATHREPFEGLAATNRFVIVDLMFHVEVRDARLFRVRAYFDLYDAATQLGVLPKPGTLGERALLALRGFSTRRRPAT